MSSKKCNKCGELRSYSDFYKNKACPSGIESTCKPCRRKKSLEYYQNNKEKVLAHVNAWRKDNPEKVRSYSSKWIRANRDKVNKYLKLKRKIDLEHKLKERLRGRINSAIRKSNAYKPSSSVKDLGCTVSEFKLYLESKFKPGMTWDNYGKYGWHIDHIKPLSLFNLSDSEEFKLACHYTNLQPLWAHENHRKSDKYDA